MSPKLEQAILQRLPPMIRNRLIQASRQHKQILRGIAWVTLFVLAAKIVAILKEILVAQKYGTSAVLDGYLLAFSLASLPILLFYGVAGLVAIPVLVQWRKADPVACAGFERQMHAAAWMLSLGTAILTFWTLPTAIRLLGLPLAIQQPALASAPWMVIAAPLGIVAAWYSVQLISLQRHANSFLDSMPSIGIAILLLWPGWRSDTLVPLLWGSVAGFGVQAIMAGILSRRAGASVGLALPRLTPQWRMIGRGFGIALAAQIVMMFTSIVESDTVGSLARRQPCNLCLR